MNVNLAWELWKDVGIEWMKTFDSKNLTEIMVI